MQIWLGKRHKKWRNKIIWNKINDDIDSKNKILHKPPRNKKVRLSKRSKFLCPNLAKKWFHLNLPKRSLETNYEKGHLVDLTTEKFFWGYVRQPLNKLSYDKRLGNDVAAELLATVLRKSSQILVEDFSTSLLKVRVRWFWSLGGTLSLSWVSLRKENDSGNCKTGVPGKKTAVKSQIGQPNFAGLAVSG